MSQTAQMESGPDHSALYAAQRAFFEEGGTLPEAVRRDRLRALAAELRRREDDIAGALAADLHKSVFEAFATETGFLLQEIDHALEHLAAWMRPTRRLAPVVAQPGRSVVYPQPLGPSLILAPWNYPVHLALAPLVGALAAGCTAVVKPSELAPASSALVAEMIGRCFSPEHVACVEGDAAVAAELLTHPWAHLFFTGGPRVGRIVARAGAEHLARVTLELGGKSPVIVLESADVELAARRIAWGKWLNAGQTCVAPDYVLVHDALHDRLVEALVRAARAMFGADPQRSPDYGRIVDDRHLARLLALIEPEKVAMGGQHDARERYLAPTLLTDVRPDDPVMADEIFGPILPVLRVSGLEQAIGMVRRHPDPLALYLFTRDREEREAVISRLSFGGGCVNNVVVHLSDPDLPFGGIRGSGVGAYHGKASFDAFTHYKSVIEDPGWRLLDPSVKYPPYDDRALSALKWWVG